jgi:hypothetical protein
MVQSLGFIIKHLRLSVWDLGVRVKGLGLRD